jgi:hypothetical protein
MDRKHIFKLVRGIKYNSNNNKITNSLLKINNNKKSKNNKKETIVNHNLKIC